MSIILASPLQPDERPVGYELLDSNKVVHIWNEYDDYYFNATSGIQFTNHYQEYWTENVFCGGFKIAGTWEYYCNDDLPFSWSIKTDNLTYVNITGYKDVTKTIGGEDYTVRFVLRYNLESNKTFLNIQPYEKNIGSNNISVDTGFAWRMRNIKIANTTENDWIYINETRYNLNETLDLDFTDLNRTEIVMHDDVEVGEWLWMNWSSNLNYHYWIKNKTGQTNAPNTLLINAGSLDVNQEKKTTFGWIDALCTWSCVLYKPSGSNPDINEGETYLKEIRISYSGTCTTFGSWSATQWYNTTDYTNMDSDSNLSISSWNPKNYFRCVGGTCSGTSWTVTGEEVGYYTARGRCEFNGGTQKSSATYNVNVSALPYTECEYVNINSDVNLTADNSSCFNIVADNINFDCNNSDLNGTQQKYDYLFKTNDKDNITIKNCVIRDYPNILNFTSANNIIFENNSAKSGSKNDTIDAWLKPLLFKNSQDIVINYSSFEDFFANNTQDAASTSEYGMIFLIASNNTISYENEFINNFAEHQITGEGGERQDRMAIYTLNVSKDLFTYDNTYNDSSRTLGIYDGGTNIWINDSYLYEDSFTVDNEDVIISGNTINNSIDANTILISAAADNITIKNNIFSQTVSGQIIQTYSTPSNITIHNNSMDGHNVSFGFLIDGSSYINVSNITLNNPYATGSPHAGGIYINGHYNKLKNIFINNYTVIATHGCGIWMSGDYNKIINVSLENSFDGDGICFLGKENKIINSTIDEAEDFDLKMRGASGNTNYIINTVFNKSDFEFSHNSLYYSMIQYYLDVQVNDSGGAVSGADVYVHNNNSIIINESSTNADGLAHFIISEYNQSGDSTYVEGCQGSTGNIFCYTPHNITVNKTGYDTNSSTQNISSSKEIFIYLTSSAAECWSYNAASKFLSIPNGCLYSTDSLYTI
jgi:hypothetical protein